MKIFYNIKHKHLIVAPFRNGSSHLHYHAIQYNLTEVTHGPIFKGIISEVEKKTFLYRDPCARLMSYYRQFVFDPPTTTSKTIIKEDADKALALKLFKPLTRGNDLLSDMVLATDNIIKNYRTDFHTTPQSDYFKDDRYEQSVNEYEIISIDQYAKWLKLTFADKETKQNIPSLDKIIINPYNFRNMQRVQDLCMTLYKDDYELLEPNITYL